MVDGLKGIGGEFQIDPESLGSLAETGTGDFDQLIANAGENLSGDSLFFLQLQQAIARESQSYQALSNVQKNRDDAREAAIRNLG
jgi:hypothetical protein